MSHGVQDRLLPSGQARRAAWMDESALPGPGATLTCRVQRAVPTDGKQEQGPGSAQFGWNTEEVKGRSGGSTGSTAAAKVRGPRVCGAGAHEPGFFLKDSGCQGQLLIRNQEFQFPDTWNYVTIGVIS